jgi:hypothetical protein
MDETPDLEPVRRGPSKVGTHTFRRQYLFAFEPMVEIRRYLRVHVVRGDAARLPEIQRAWDDAQPRIKTLNVTEVNLADSILMEAVPPQYTARIDKVLDSDRLRKTLPLKWDVRLVEIDKLVAAQRQVNLEHVDRLRQSFPKDLTLEALIDICLTPDPGVVPIQHLEPSLNVHTFTSPSGDFRMLGSFFHELSDEEAELSPAIGTPVAAVITFVGYGAATANVYWNGKRCVLNNGFHRIYALRQAGVTKVPVVVQHAMNVLMEFPANVSGLSREYLLNHPRPALMKDFFDDKFSTVLRVQNYLRMVSITTEVTQNDMPA